MQRSRNRSWKNMAPKNYDCASNSGSPEYDQEGDK